MRLVRKDSASPRDLGAREALARHFVLEERPRGGAGPRLEGGKLEGYNVFLDAGAGHRLPADCCAVSVTPLLREVVHRLATQPRSEPDEVAGRLVAVLLDELATVAIDKHRLPMPTDPRLQKLVARMTLNPSEGADLKTSARRVGVSERTLNRLLVVAATLLAAGVGACTKASCDALEVEPPIITIVDRTTGSAICDASILVTAANPYGTGSGAAVVATVEHPLDAGIDGSVVVPFDTESTAEAPECAVTVSPSRGVGVYSIQVRYPGYVTESVSNVYGEGNACESAGAEGDRVVVPLGRVEP